MKTKTSRAVIFFHSLGQMVFFGRYRILQIQRSVNEHNYRWL